MAMGSPKLKQITAQILTPEAFAPYGQAIFTAKDGKPFDAQDAQLQLHNGVPRFYIMRLHNRGRRFHKITRHLQCTQCLGSLEGKEWLIGVAPPSAAASPEPGTIAVFRIPGTCFIKLEVGTWHAGPYFDGAYVDFYNLELSDTNVTDHDVCNLLETYNTEFEIT